jgi:tetratricopeptide (TPR) repeat protein
MSRILRYARYVCLPLIIVLASCSRDPVAQSQRLVESGNKFYAKGKYREASIMYRRALQKNQKNGDAYYRQGLAALKLGQGNDAAAALRRALTLPPVNPDAPVKLADLYWYYYAGSQGPAREKAKTVLPEIEDISKDMLKKDPKSFDGLRFKAYLELANNNLPAAISSLEAANQVKPYDPGLSLYYVQALMQANRMPEAEKVAKEMIARQKNLYPMYIRLAGMYLTEKRTQDAEQILKLQADNNPHAESPLVMLATFYALSNRRGEMEATLKRILDDPKDFPTGRLTVGAFFVRLRDYPRAQQEFDEGIKGDPKNKALYQKATVETLVAQGKDTEASQLINEVLKQDPKDSQAISMRSALLLKAGSPDQVKQAVSDLQGLVSRNPNNGRSRFQLGQALLANKQADAARIQLEEAKKLEPGLTGPRVLLARIYSEKRDWARSLAESEEVLAMQPGNYAARLLHSSALIGLGKKEDARKEILTLLKQAPNSPDAQYQLAWLSLQEKDFKEAETLFNQMRATNPNDPRGLAGVVESEVAQSDYKSALVLLREEVQKNPNRLDYRMGIANILLRDKQYDAAIQELQQVVAKDPKSSDAYVRLGAAYQLKGDTNDAIENYRKAKSFAALGDALPATRLALLVDSSGRHDEAQVLYEDILKIDPNSVVALNNLAYIKAEQGKDLDNALTLAQRARQQYPRDPNVADTLGWIYIKKNLSDDAIRIYREVVSTAPENAAYHYHFAMALYQKGDKQGAKQALDEALKRGPKPPEQQGIKELMAKVGS